MSVPLACPQLRLARLPAGMGARGPQGTMEKRYRLRKNADFQQVRRQGRSWANELLVLNIAPNGLEHSRFGFSVSRRLGKAVVRNRAKRLMREAIRRQRERLPAGWDVILIARLPMREASFSAVERAVEQLLRHARLLNQAPVSQEQAWAEIE